ncbi:MAG: hypothetical protein ACREOU_07940 [Candidatus Eiseniibacteriota bacterium]
MALADSVMRGMGGQEAWDRTMYLAFDFAVSRNDTVLVRRTTRWEKGSNRIRISGTDGKGRPFVVLTDLGKRNPRAWVAGEPQDSAALGALADRAYAIWVNDTYWLLMPYKLRDPGVSLTDAGVDSTGTFRKLHLEFNKVGLTPKDQYWVYVDGTGHVRRWDMLLQGSKDGRPRPAIWSEWKKHGEIELAELRDLPEDGVEIRFENIVAARTTPTGAFDP